MSDPVSKATKRTGWPREAFIEHLLHAADEDENAGHSLQGAYIRDAADEITRLRALVIHYADQAGVTAEEVRDEETKLFRYATHADIRRWEHMELRYNNLLATLKELANGN